MTGYSFELSDKQSSRVLAQALNAESPVWAEAIDQSRPRSFTGRLIEIEDAVMSMAVSSERPELTDVIPGQYYQLVINVADTRYLAICDLVETQVRQDAPTLVFARPEVLQVLQRRRLARVKPSRSYPVNVSWEDPEDRTTKQGFGHIQELSFQGMSIILPAKLDEHLFIGEVLNLRFTLSARQPEFVTDASICHKEIMEKRPEVLVGTQFLPNKSDDTFQARLQAAWVAECGSNNQSNQGNK